MKPTAAYPKPGPAGGVLIRRVIALLRNPDLHIEIPFQPAPRVWIAVSGGPDSLALSLLIVKYGRRVCAPGQVGLIHVNHGWRGLASDRDEKRVRNFGKKWGIQTLVLAGKRLHEEPGRSWEEAARDERRRIFSEHVSPRDWLFTAHTADDQAETVLWRLATGAFEKLGAGIRIRDQRKVRPFLTTRKSELQKFLREERQAFGIDQSNFDERFLRARLRKRIMPELEKAFPRVVENLVDLGLRHPGCIKL
ncbi:MAG: tRNA lysidine(34) synthetase TilS [Bdellovibrionota bacterium]